MNFTKAKMLLYLQENIKDINILPLFIIDSNEYFNNKVDVVNAIIKKFKDQKVIVRSSSRMEDTYNSSNAGKFDSILNVELTLDSVCNAIEKVYSSYKTIENEEILVQPMIQNINKSGVIFTSDMETFADYYVVNYQEGSDTEAVTSGNTNQLKTFIAYKQAPFGVSDLDMMLLIESCKKIEQYLKNQSLDIEFAINSAHKVYILQVRPISKGNKNDYLKYDLSKPLNRIYKKIKKLTTPHPFLLGQSTYFGVMPDWNPAEILGIRPKKLAISLYKELVTDSIWAHQRKNYGYRDLTMHPLMISFCGIPYIDTRVTFNSFVPQNLNETIAEKLINYYLEQLSKYPKYHDKIEFEIVFSCYYMGMSDKLKELLDYGFNENELKRIEYSLLELTNNIIHPDKGLYKQDIERIKVLENNYNRILESNISHVDKIYWLIEECKEYGTLPFAGVARAAFIAIQFLRSFISSGIITKEEYDSFMNSLNTVNKHLGKDVKKLIKGELSRSAFCEKYGHIRPGTYDIMSNRYDEDFDNYFGKQKAEEQLKAEDTFSFSDCVLDKIQLELEQNGLDVTAKELMVFIRETIEGREYLKFIFTKSVSKILQIIEELGKRTGIKKEELSYLDIATVKQLYVDLYNGNIAEIFHNNIEKNKVQYECAKQIKLPSIIVNPEDVYSYFLLSEEPNFITQSVIVSEGIQFHSVEEELEGKIVFIQSADPGYDFLFSKKIGGLVTQFGGANSHMAIRCAELGIPAVIGAGDKNYQEWKKYKKLKIDCLKKQVISIIN